MKSPGKKWSAPFAVRSFSHLPDVRSKTKICGGIRARTACSPGRSGISLWRPSFRRGRSAGWQPNTNGIQRIRLEIPKCSKYVWTYVHRVPKRVIKFHEIKISSNSVDILNSAMMMKLQRSVVTCRMSNSDCGLKRALDRVKSCPCEIEQHLREWCRSTAANVTFDNFWNQRFNIVKDLGERKIMP